MSARPAMNGQWMTRRRMLGVAGGAAAAIPLAACGSGAPESDTEGGGGGTFLAFWNAAHWYDAYDEAIKAFEKEHGVTVQVQKFQWEDMRTQLITTMQSGNVPDVVEEPGGWPQEFAVSGDVLSLQKFIDKDGAKLGYPDDWLDEAVRKNSHEGEVYGIQLHYTCSLLFYNKKMFEDAGLEPPTTWDEVVDVAKELTSGDVNGIALNSFADYSWPWMLSNGVHEWDKDTNTFLQPRDKAVETLQFMADLVYKHKVAAKPVVSPDPTGQAKLFGAERAAMIVTGPWDIPLLAESAPDLDYGIAQMPKGTTQSTIAAGTSVFIPKKAKRPEMSWDFIKRLTTLETELAATKEATMLMPRKSWAEDPAVQGDEKLAAFSEGLTYAEEFREDTYQTGAYGELGDLYLETYENIIIKGEPVEKALAAYDAKAEKLVEG